MLYIRKIRTPRIIQECREKIIKTPDCGFDEIVLPEDVKRLRKLFDLMPKAEIRKALCREQHGLCAYCMRRIVPQKQDENEEEARIEHYVPLSVNKELALEYDNFLGVCYGGNEDEREPGQELITCCDAHRGDAVLTIDPRNKRQMEAIAYRRDGYIFVKKDMGLDDELVNVMQKDIDEVLQLNGELSTGGIIKHDTTSRLIASRKRVYDSVSSQLNRWDKNGVLTSDYLQEMIDKLSSQLCGNAEAEPFIGVRIYHLKKRLKQLKKEGR